jgi:hypothetical protein
VPLQAAAAAAAAGAAPPCLLLLLLLLGGACMGVRSVCVVIGSCTRRDVAAHATHAPCRTWRGVIVARAVCLREL